MIVLAIPPVEATLCVTHPPLGCTPGEIRAVGGAVPMYKRLISLIERDARRVEVGARVAIAATRKAPEEAEWTLPYPPWTMWLDEFGVRVLQHYTFTDANTIATYKAWPLPLGAIVGSATVEAVVPIVENYDSTRRMQGQTYIGVSEFSGGLAMLYDRGRSSAMTDLSDQLAYDTGLTPGRWAVLLADAVPTSERCLRCGSYTRIRFGGGEWQCPSRHSLMGDLIPYTATGRVGRWEP